LTHIGYEESQSLMERMQAAGWLGLVEAAEGAEAPRRFRWRRGPGDSHDRWVLLANPAQLTLADVYRHFVFDAQTQREQESAVVQQIGAAIDAALHRSLAAYFDGDAKSTARFDAALQKQLKVAEPGTAS
jgi:membrane protein